MKKVLLTLALALAALAYCGTAYAEAGGGDRPQRPDGFQKGGMQAPGMMSPFALAPTEEFKMEMKRHSEAAGEIMAELRELAMKLRELVKAEVEKEMERIKAENPDVAPEDLPKPDFKAIAEKVREQHKPEVRAIVAKLVDEDFAHTEKLLAIKKQTRDTVIDDAVEKMGNLGERVREGMQGREGGMRGNRGEGGDRGPKDREEMRNMIREKIKQRIAERMQNRQRAE
ncbi:MAG: hypothetical protein Kow00107_05640 [Planctomycetota bacterium]